MKRVFASPFRIALCYFIFMVSLCLFVIFYASPYLLGDRVRGLDEQVYDFDRRLERIDHKNFIIAGPSYAGAFGEMPGVSNISFGSATPQELEFLLSKYCRPTDRILYFCSMMDTGYADAPPRDWIISMPMRRLYITKAAFGYTPPIPEASVHLFLREREHRIYSQRQLDFSFYDRLRSQFPNIIFVVQPLVPPEEVLECYPEIERLLSQYEEQMRWRYNALCLFDYVDRRYMADDCHLNPEGVSIARNRLFGHLAFLTSQ